MRRILRYLAMAAGFAFVLVVAYIAMAVSRFDDAYAQWGAADMVIDHMADHQGQWPRDWSDLKPYFEAGGGRVGGWSFEKFQEHVWIDFAADPKELHRLSQGVDQPSFNVIDSTSFFGPQFEDGPNGMLLRHFKSLEAISR